MNKSKSKCLFVVELQSEDGHRYWSGSMDEERVSNYIDNSLAEYGDMLSDIDHAGPCHGTCYESAYGRIYN